jgi:hypothetical protein
MRTAGALPRSSQGQPLTAGTPPRSPRGQTNSHEEPTTPRSRTPNRSPRSHDRPTTPPNEVADQRRLRSGAQEATEARPRTRGITAARASALWRQQTLTEHDAERRTLQERVEQMRKQIDSERAAGPRRIAGSGGV